MMARSSAVEETVYGLDTDGLLDVYEAWELNDADFLLCRDCLATTCIWHTSSYRFDRGL